MLKNTHQFIPCQASAAVLKLELDGGNAGEDATGLLISPGGATVRGLVINRFDWASIGSNTV